MKPAPKIVLSFAGLTVAGFAVGGFLSAITIVSFFPREGSLIHNLGWGVRAFPLIPFVLTFGLPVSLTTIPWLAWPSLAGLGMWIVAGILTFSTKLKLSYPLAFAGASMWSIILVPAAKMLSSI